MRTLFLNDELINELEIDKEYIGKEKTRQLMEIKRRKSLYRNSKEKGLDISEQNSHFRR